MELAISTSKRWFVAPIRPLSRLRLCQSSREPDAQRLTDSALNFKLQPGSNTTTVTVTDAAPIVDTTTSSTGTVIEGTQVTDSP